jgi:hypothetical protein
MTAGAHEAAAHADSGALDRQATRSSAPGVMLAYVGANAMLLKGPVSRRVYALRPGMPPLTVDARDMTAFLSSRLFSRHP